MIYTLYNTKNEVIFKGDYSSEIAIVREAAGLGDHPTLAIESKGLRNAQLSGMKLDGIDLEGADLRDAELRNTSLIGANLSMALLQGADLTRAKLNDADMTNCSLVMANLSEAVLAHTNLDSADLTEANMYNAYLTGAVLTYANLKRARLLSADIHNAASLVGVKFSETVMHSHYSMDGETRYVGVDALLAHTIRSDGYHFLLYRLSNGEYRVKAGCRWFTIGEYRHHITSAAFYGRHDSACETARLLSYFEDCIISDQSVLASKKETSNISIQLTGNYRVIAIETADEEVA